MNAIKSHRPRIEYALEIWDWVENYRDMAKFRRLIDQAVGVGFNTIELSVAWKDFEPQQGRFAWEYVDQRIRTVLDRRLPLRVRINFSHAEPWPAWVNPVMSLSPDGRDEHRLMSIFDRHLNELQEKAATALVAHWRGAGIEWCPVFGMHTEVKLGTWIGYESAARTPFAEFLRSRYGGIDALNRAWEANFANFRQVHLPLPKPTADKPDLSRPSCDWIRFREEALAGKMAGLLAAVRRGDPDARTSVMLGESFRAGSAEMANLAYEPYSRTASRVIHSYDFFWHKPADREAAGLAVEIMQGVTGKPVVLEMDGPNLQDQWGYRDADLVAIGLTALDHGAAGLNVANYSYTDKPLSDFPFLAQLGREIATRNALSPAAVSHAPTSQSAGSGPATPGPVTEYYYVSKWANYVYRGGDESVHERQFAPYLKLREAGHRLRIITDDNLLRDRFDRASCIYVAPVLAIDEVAVRRLQELSATIRIEPANALAGAAIVH